jgi:deferrochelatase/peroxidase EfeB
MPEGTRGWLSRALRTLGFDRRHLHEDFVSSTRFHRLLRRGRKFTRSSPSESDKAERGLYFICLNANIGRQFEFVQASWLENPKFDGLDHSDPLLGSRKPLWSGGRTDEYKVPDASGFNCHYTNLPRFVTVRGGAYFFMPGIKALQFIASD